MADALFQSTTGTCRLIRVPANLSGGMRARFVAAIRQAVEKQARIAESCDGMLALSGEVIEADATLIIPHEPASSAIPEAIVNGPRPDIYTLWWLTRATIAALRAAADARLVHGGLQLGSVMLDAVGRVKLTDFGLAPAFELVGDSETLGRLLCDARPTNTADGAAATATWSLASDESHEHGWITPYFAHEVLSGDARLNPSADQFALGTLLYAWATGVLPFGQEFSDPSIFAHFQIEPTEFEEHREDWAPYFERASRGESLTGDAAVIDWSGLVLRLLARLSSDRFSDLGEAQTIAEAFTLDTWSEFEQTLRDAAPLLAEQQYDEYLNLLGPWLENTTLPEVQRVRLNEHVQSIEAERKTAAAQRAYVERLSEARQAAGEGRTDEAVRIARELVENPQTPDEIRHNAQQLADECAETIRETQARARRDAEDAMRRAREALDAGRFDDAREAASYIEHIDAAPDDSREQAAALLAEIDAAAKAHARTTELLAAARSELGAGRFDAARAALAQLADDTTSPDAQQAARELAGEIDAAEAECNEITRILDECAAALEAGELGTALQRIDECPADTPYEHVAARRGELAAACARLRDCCEALHSLDLKLVEGRADEALAACQEALADADLPPKLRERFSELAQRCRAALEEEAEARLERMRQALADARAHWERGESAACRELLNAVRREPLLPDEQRAEVEALLAACDALDRAERAFAEAQELLQDDQFEQAIMTLDGVAVDEAPRKLREQISELRARITQRQSEHAQERLARFEQALDELDQHLSAGRIAEASSLSNQISPPPDAPDETKRRLERSRREIAEHAEHLAALERIEKALADARLDDAEGSLERLGGAESPAWARTRADELRAQLADARERHREEQIARLRGQLDDAQAALEAGRLDDAETLLAEIDAHASIADELVDRHKQLTQQAKELRAWRPQVEELAAQLRAGAIARMHPAARRLLEEQEPPRVVKEQVQSLLTQAEERIRDERARIDDELASLGRTLDARGRRARDFPARTAAILENPLATRKQRSAAQDLQTRFDELPPPASPAKPVIIGSAAVALVVVGWFVIRPMLSGEGGPAPSPNPPSPLVVDLIADSLTVSGRRATITYTVAGDEQAPPFDIVLFADRNENGRADAGEALDRTPGEAAPGSHQAAFDLPGDFVGRIGVAFDTGDWSDDVAREATAANNMQFASVAEMGVTPTPPVETPRMVDVAVDELSVADQEAAVVYSVAGDGEAPPYDIVLFRDDNGNRLPDPGEEIQRFPGEPQAGEHRIALHLPAGFEGTLVAQIDASQWPTDARDPAPDNNTRFASVAMTADERVARALADFPPQIEPTISLVELLSARGGDANAVGAALAALGVPQTADVEWRDAWTPIAGDEPSAQRNADWTRPEDDESVTLLCVIRFDAERQTWLADWSFSDGAFAAVSAWLRERATRRIAQRNADGHWGAARRLYAATARLFAAWNAPLDDGMLAPAWSGLAGFAPPEDWNAEEDPVGYPPLLRSTDGTRTFRRVSLTARSPVWELLGVAPQSRRAVLFYVDEQEAPEAFDRLETADEAARRWGAQIPTREEWTLAALALGDAAWDLGFFDGRYEWCRDPSDPKNPTWVCGGCDLLDVLKPPPGKGPPTPALVQWLNHPLVSQPRVHGDGLATLRAVVHPFALDAFARLAEQ